MKNLKKYLTIAMSVLMMMTVIPGNISVDGNNITGSNGAVYAEETAEEINISIDGNVLKSKYERDIDKNKKLSEIIKNLKYENGYKENNVEFFKGSEKIDTNKTLSELAGEDTSLKLTVKEKSVKIKVEFERYTGIAKGFDTEGKSGQKISEILDGYEFQLEEGYEKSNIKYCVNGKWQSDSAVVKGEENSTITIKVTADAPVEVNFKKGNHIKGIDKKTTIQKGQSLEEAWDKIKSTVEYYDDYEFYRFEDAKGNEIKDSKEIEKDTTVYIVAKLKNSVEDAYYLDFAEKDNIKEMKIGEEKITGSIEKVRVKKGTEVEITAYDYEKNDDDNGKFTKWEGLLEDEYYKNYKKDDKTIKFEMPKRDVELKVIYGLDKDKYKEVDVELKSEKEGDYDDGYIDGKVKDYKGEEDEKIYVWIEGKEYSGEVEKDGKFYIKSKKVEDMKYRDIEKLDFYMEKDDETSYEEVPVDEDKIDYNDDYTKVEGKIEEKHISEYEGKNIKVFLGKPEEGVLLGEGKVDRKGNFEIKIKKISKSLEDDVTFYIGKTSLMKGYKEVDPDDVELYDKKDRKYRKVKGLLKDHENEKIYVYLDEKEVGKGEIGKDGKFDIKFDKDVDYKTKERDLKFYIRTDITKKATITSAFAGEKVVEGKDLDKKTDVTVKDKNDKELGKAVTKDDGTFKVELNRKLEKGETISVYAKEAGKDESKVEWKVIESIEKGGYIGGYPDGTFRPNNPMTRAEATMMVARLKNGSDNFNMSKITKFRDASNEWYSEAINYATEKGLVSGYGNDTFKPNQKITRAEFVSMIYGEIESTGGSVPNFNDLRGHWAAYKIEKAAAAGIVSGYPGGDFRPDKNVTRAEAVKILNKTFNIKEADSYRNTFSDVMRGDWYYNDVMNAANK